MAIALVASTKFAGLSGGDTPPIDTTGANCIAVFMAYGGSPTLTDNKGNTYTAGAEATGTPSGRWYYCLGAATGSGHTWTVGGGSTASSIIVYALSGVAAAGAYSSPGNTAIATDPWTFRVSATPPEDNCIVLMGGALGAVTLSSVTPASGWTNAQWQTGVGGTNYGNVVVHQVQTTARTVDANEALATLGGNPAGTTVAAFFKAGAAPSGTITLTDVADYRVLQRNGTSASLAISGTHSGATSVQARVVMHGTNTEVVTWTTIDAAPGASTFAGTLTGIPQGGWYSVQVRQGNSTAVTSNGANHFGVGCLIAVIGQSQGVHWFSDGTAVSPNALLAQYSSSGWAARTSTGNAANSFGNRVIAGLGGNIPVALLSYSIGSTALRQEADSGSGYWMNTAAGSPYDLFKTGVNAVGGKLEAAIWMQGEQDAYSGVVTESEYSTDLQTLFARIRTDFSQAALPIVVTPLAGFANGGTSTEASWEGVRQAQVAVGKLTNNTLAAFNQDIPLVDGVHYTAAGYTTHGNRGGLAMLAALGLSSYARGPVISAASRPTSTTVEVTLTHRGGSDFTPTSGITGFEVLDGGTPVTINSVVRTSATKITITLAAALSGAGTLRYQYGRTPTVSAPVLDNTSLALPIGLESGSAMAIAAPGTIVTDGFRDPVTNALEPGATIPHVLLISPSTGVVAVSLTNQTTAGDGTLTIANNASLTPGQPYLVVSFSNDGVNRGAKVYTAT